MNNQPQTSYDVNPIFYQIHDMAIELSKISNTSFYDILYLLLNYYGQTQPLVYREVGVLLAVHPSQIRYTTNRALQRIEEFPKKKTIIYRYTDLESKDYDETF